MLQFFALEVIRVWIFLTPFTHYTTLINIRCLLEMTITNSTYLQKIFVTNLFYFSYFYIQPDDSHLVLKHVADHNRIQSYNKCSCVDIIVLIKWKCISHKHKCYSQEHVCVLLSRAADWLYECEGINRCVTRKVETV